MGTQYRIENRVVEGGEVTYSLMTLIPRWLFFPQKWVYVSRNGCVLSFHSLKEAKEAIRILRASDESRREYVWILNEDGEVIDYYNEERKHK